MPEFTNQRLQVLEQAFLSIFKVYRDHWNIEKVRYLGVGSTHCEKNKKVFRFVAIVSSPILFKEEIIPTQNELITLKNKYIGSHITGPDLFFKTKEQTWSDYKEQRINKKFIYAGNLSPESIIDFRIGSGFCRVKMEINGVKF